ncbi:MAG: hypothetical protein ACXVZO_02695 [Gaiellaceae bacterium]
MAIDAKAPEHVGEPSELLDAGAGLEALSREIIGALEAMRRLPMVVDDNRFRGAYEELMTALVWTKDLLIDARTALAKRAPPPI